MTEVTQPQLNANSKVYILNLAGGLGARVIQTCFIRSLITQRKAARNSYPICVIDNSIIGAMACEGLKNQNVISIRTPETPNAWPHHPGIMSLPNGEKEHPIFIDTWRENFKNYNTGGWLWEVLNNNWDRAYTIDYSFGLTKAIHLHKMKNNKTSFIGYHYARGMQDLEYDGGVPMLKVTQYNPKITNFITGLKKPFILLHLGCDMNNNDFMNPVNYRFHKVWSLQRWAELVQKMKHKYEFVQVWANNHNTEIPDVKSIKVENLNPVLQLLEHEKCKFFMSIDNYLPHLASSIKKPGIVMWGSVSPYIWGWNKTWHKVPHLHVWNTSSCPTIACWRPSLFDVDPNGKTWVCDKEYKCMKSITVDQVIKNITTLEETYLQEKNSDNIVL